MNIHITRLREALETLPEELGKGYLLKWPPYEYCAVGWLAHKAGVEEEDLLGIRSLNTTGNQDIVGDYYNMSYTDIDDLMDANDTSFKEERRQKVMFVMSNIIRSMEEENKLIGEKTNEQV